MEKEHAQRDQSGVIAGRNAVLEAVRAGRPIDKIFMAKSEREGTLSLIFAAALARGIPVVDADRRKLDAMAGGVIHQGVVALAAAKDYCGLEDVLRVAEERGESPFIIVADGIEDPQNLGAIIRTADAAGSHGVVVPKRRAAGLTAATARASAGALEHVAVARVSNIPSAIDSLKARGIWVFGAEAGAGVPYFEADLKGPIALVIGAEGRGISPLAREKCDFLISIPMRGRISSLNASAAAAVLAFEAARQRRS